MADNIALQSLDFMEQQTTDAILSGAISFEAPIGKYAVAPWIDPPEGFLSFDEYGVSNGPLAVLSTATVLTVIVPQGYDGVIKGIMNTYTGGGFNEGSGDLVWRINIDGRPAKGYSNMTFQVGGLVQGPRPIAGIRVFSGNVITVTIFHAANATLGDNFISSLTGWFYPRSGE